MSERTAVLSRLRHLPNVNWLSAAATFLLVATVLGVVLDIVLWAGQRFLPPPVSFINSQFVFVAEMFYAISYAFMGWLLATRLQRNPLGWVLLLLGAFMSAQLTVTFLIQEGHQAFRPIELPLLLGAWLSSSAHLPVLALLTNVFFLRFPTGRPLTPRWRFAGIVTFIGTVLVIIGIGLAPTGLAWYPSLTNIFAAPFAMRPLLNLITLAGLSTMVVGVAVGTASMVVRYHRSNDRERAQLRWIAAAVLALSISGMPFMVVRYGLQADYATGHLLLATALAAACLLPIAAAVAILHHRLYDIDLILNRALVYIPLTGILGGTFAGGVVLFQRLFLAVTGDTSDAAIVISTLVLAGMFTPVRNWLQAFVDRRFKPHGDAHYTGLHMDEEHTIEQRIALLEERLARMESSGPPPDSYED